MRISKISKFLLVLVLANAWIFGGWPRIWEQPPFPPEINEAQAALGTGGATCTNQGKTATSSTSITCTVATQNIEAGNIAMLWFAGDNTATVDGNDRLLSSVTDSAGNNWIVDRCFTNAQGAAAAGATTCIAHSKLTTQLTSGSDTITANYASITAKAIVTKEFTIGAGKTLVIVGTPQFLANDGADPGAMTVSGLANAEHFFGRATALERAAGGTWTVTAGFTTSGCNGTAGAGAASNMESCGEFKILTATATTSDPGGTAVDNANIFLALDEVAVPDFEQSAYRWFENTNTTQIGPALAAQDASSTLSSTGQAFRLRMLIHVATTSVPLSGQRFTLQFVGKGTGTCAAPTGGTPSTYTNVTAATVIAYNNNTPADGDALTATSTPTHGGDTIVNQTYEELNDFTNSIAAIAVGQDGNWDFALIDNSAPADTTYCLRAVKSDGSTLLNTYTVFPEVTTAAVSVSCDASITTTTFGTLSSSAVSTSTPNASTTMTCGGAAGCTLSVIDTNRGLATNTPAYLIPSPDAAFNSTSTLAAGTEGYGVNATTTAGGSGGTLTIYERYVDLDDSTKVGGLASTSALGLASSTAAITNRQLIVKHKAAVSGTTQAAAFTDTITYSCAAN